MFLHHECIHIFTKNVLLNGALRVAPCINHYLRLVHDNWCGASFEDSWVLTGTRISSVPFSCLPDFCARSACRRTPGPLGGGNPGVKLLVENYRVTQNRASKKVANLRYLRYLAAISRVDAPLADPYPGNRSFIGGNFFEEEHSNIPVSRRDIREHRRACFFISALGSSSQFHLYIQCFGGVTKRRTWYYGTGLLSQLHGRDGDASRTSGTDGYRIDQARLVPEL